MSMAAASWIADSRVTRMPFSASARAPSAADMVNMVGSATGTAATNSISPKGSMLSNDSPWISAAMKTATASTITRAAR